MVEPSTRDMSGRASEILDQWRKDQQQQTDPRLSLVETVRRPSSSMMWTSPMTTASNSQGAITLVTDPDESDLFSEGHSLELDETVLGGRRIHTLRQQLLTAYKQKEEIQITVQRALYRISDHIDEVATLCHEIAVDEFPLLASSSRRHLSPNDNIRSRMNKFSSPSYTSGGITSTTVITTATNSKLEDQAVFQNIMTCLEQDIPYSIHALQTVIRERVSQVQRHIEQLQQEDERKRNNQLQQWNQETEQRREQMETSQQELKTVQTQLKNVMENLKQTETLWTCKQKECEDIDIVCQQRLKDADLIQHKAQEKKTHLSILEASLYSQKEELKLERKTILQQRIQLEQDLKNFRLEVETFEQKRKEMMIVQTELLELEVLQRTKEEEIEQREYQWNMEKQRLQDIQCQIQKDREWVQNIQEKTDHKILDLQARELQFKKDQDAFTEEHHHFSQRLGALERREKELDEDRSGLQKIQNQFAKAVSLAKTDIENQRINIINTEQQKFMEERRIFMEECECQRKWLENVTQSKIVEEQRVTHLKNDQTILEQKLVELRDEIEKYRVLRDENEKVLSEYIQKNHETQSQYKELQWKVSNLDELLSQKGQELEKICKYIRDEENIVHQLADKRKSLQDCCDQLCKKSDALQSEIDQLVEKLKSSQQEQSSKDDAFKNQCQQTMEGLVLREATLKSKQEDLRLKEEKVASEKQTLDQRKAKLHETESKLKNIAQILKTREKAVTEREEKEKISREGDLKKLIAQLKDMIEMEKQRFKELLQEKEKLEEESRFKDVALHRLRNMCLTEENSCHENPSDSQSEYERLQQLALSLKQKDDDLAKESEILQSKILQCTECERSLMEWQYELESLARSLIHMSNR